MKHGNCTYKILIILITTLGGMLFLTKGSYASNPTVVGFIIEAGQLEGTLQDPLMTVGNTSVEKNRSMLELKFDDLLLENFVIKKIIKTSQGLVTTTMTSKEKVLLKNLTISVTNAKFSEPFLPETGNIGLKNVSLLAHNMKTDSSHLPQLQLSFNEGGQVELEPKSEAGLLQMKASLEELLANSQQ